MKPAPVKQDITFGDFEKLDIRAGTITQVADVADSRKLVKLTVDFGDHTRSIVAGITLPIVGSLPVISNSRRQSSIFRR